MSAFLTGPLVRSIPGGGLPVDRVGGAVPGPVFKAIGL